jgi:nitrite reductase/ring-hydroxylating ferredoxin subunit
MNNPGKLIFFMKKIFVCRTGDLLQKSTYVFNPDSSEQIVLFKTEKGIFATENRCPHAGAFLHEGRVKNKTLTCIWHGWKFDLENGKCLNEEWADLKTYPVEIENNEIFVLVDSLDSQNT